jgi:Cell wall-associated hydrolases (invasion-associated proteins)
MVSQLLYNDLYLKIDMKDSWVLIQTTLDNYEGWIPANQHHPITEEKYNECKAASLYATTDPITNFENKFLSLGSLFYEFHAGLTKIPESFDPEKMITYGKKLIGAPYLWGGKSVFGIDCSGFVQTCARAAGLFLPRDASQQMQCGSLVYFLPETKAGDFAFFGKEDGSVTHVGIIIGNEQILHASGCVRIDYLDQTGIYNQETETHTHQLLAIKRLL